MYWDYQALGSWKWINREVGRKLHLNNAKLEFRCFRGVGHALFESCLGLVRLHPHKNKIFYFPNRDPFFSEPVKFLAGEGCDLHPLPPDSLENPSSVLDKFDRETLMILLPEDEVFTARKNQVHEFCEALEDKRVFRLRLSHHKHMTEGLHLHPHRMDVFLYSMGPDFALTLSSDRAAFVCPIADSLNWCERDLENLQDRLRKVQLLSSQKVEEFEATKPGGSEPLLPPGTSRTFDRALLYWTDMDGHAFVHYLARALGFSLRPAGEEFRLETTSLSRWGGVKTMDWLKNRGFTPEQIRGLVMISHELIHPKLPEVIAEVRKKVLKLQGGSSEDSA
jgi:hypothetical protein